MGNHPNRGAASACSNPPPAQIKAAREKFHLSRNDAADLVLSSVRSWEKWENGERRMHPAIWELFNIKLMMKA
jgi:DNA-binding transcriptional regulator YiaG